MAENENIDRTIRVNAGLRRRRAEGKIGRGAEIYGYRNGDAVKLTICERFRRILRERAYTGQFIDG